MKDIENTKKEAPVKEAPMLGLTGMGGGIASLMWHHAGGVETGYLYAWGNNSFGNYGKNDRTTRSSPIQVGTDSDWSTLSNSAQEGFTSFQGKKDGTLWVTGSPKEDGGGTMRGTTGLNNQVIYSSPVQLPGAWTGDIANGQRYHLATKSDGTLWSWGTGTNGGLGQNNLTAYSSPVQIPGTWAITIGSVAASQHTSAAIKANGTLWTWGRNENGLMAFSNQSPNYRRSSPVQVGTDNTWNTIMGDSWGAFIATKTDGTFWSWGYGVNGNLGLNTITQRSSPTQVGEDNNWSGGINSGNRSIFATKTDGTLWAWGSNYYGELGLSDKTLRSSPTQLPGTTWKTEMRSVGSTTYSRAAVKTDGTIWTWGQNEVGQLGLNNKTNYSSPKLIPGTSWIAVGGLTQAKGFHALKK